MVDTGADSTFLMPADARTMSLDYSQLHRTVGASFGAGGPITSFSEPAWVAFSDGTTLYGYWITIAILENRADMLHVPTLLGRDVLHRWSMAYNFSERQLEFEVLSADVAVPVDSLNTPPSVRPLHHQ